MDNLARIKKRILGAVVDYGLILTVTIGYTIVFGESNVEGEKSVQGMKALPIFLLWFIYFPVIEGITGQTLGKKIMGTQVIKANGEDVTIGSSVVRHFLDVVDLNFGGLIAIIVMKNSDQKQRVGDLVAKTIVVEEKYTFCENCRTELTLDRKELRAGQFVCPKCKHENTLSSWQHLYNA